MTTINPCPICEKRPEAVRVGTEDGGYWSCECNHLLDGFDQSLFIGCHSESEESAVAGWNRLTAYAGPASLDEALNSGDGTYRP